MASRAAPRGGRGPRGESAASAATRDRPALSVDRSRPRGPATLDYAASQKLVDPIETGTLTGGTAIGTGLATGINVLRDSDAKSKVVILLTDGENNGGDITPLDAANMAKLLDVRVYTIGAITLNATADQDVSSDTVDEQLMRKIAEGTGGHYYSVPDENSLAAFAGTGARLASASPARQVTKLILVGAGCLLVVVALVGPEIGEAPRRAPISTLDTIVALDISQSMAVRDVETDRLHVAQRAIELLGQQLSGGRVGLTLFGGSSVLRYPLTASTKIVGPALDTSGHGFHVQPGSSLQAALDGAAAQFPTTAADDLRTRAIVVVSDGEDPVPDLPVLDPYLARGIHVFTPGIGTPAGGPVPG